MKEREKQMVLCVLEGIFLGKQTRERVFDAISSDIQKELALVDYPYISDIQGAVARVLYKRIVEQPKS